MNFSCQVAVSTQANHRWLHCTEKFTKKQAGPFRRLCGWVPIGDLSICPNMTCGRKRSVRFTPPGPLHDAALRSSRNTLRSGCRATRRFPCWQTQVTGISRRCCRRIKSAHPCTRTGCPRCRRENSRHRRIRTDARSTPREGIRHSGLTKNTKGLSARLHQASHRMYRGIP